VIPLPAINSVPWTETWCGLPLHLAAGTHATLVIRTLVTWGLLAVVGLRGAAGALGAAGTGEAAAPGDAAPPAFVATAGDAPASVASTAPSAAARSARASADRLWAVLGAKTIPSTAGRSGDPLGGVRG
jgi:hypothetical protein